MDSLPPERESTLRPEQPLATCRNSRTASTGLCGPSWRPQVRRLATGAAKNDATGVRPGGSGRYARRPSPQSRAQDHPAVIKPMAHVPPRPEPHPDAASRHGVPAHANGPARPGPLGRSARIAARVDKYPAHLPHRNIRNCRPACGRRRSLCRDQRPVRRLWPGTVAARMAGEQFSSSKLSGRRES
jgi:hypothetical protein